MNKNDFNYKRIAQGYLKRPYLHKALVEQFQAKSGKQIFESGLDVGCGAGLSTKALSLICKKVVGIDVSNEMVEVAKEVCAEYENISYKISGAEEYSDDVNKYDIVTAAGVVQWVDKNKFLNSMSKIMKNEGYLLIYDFSISDEMVGCEEYTRWWKEQYLKEFPKPYRNEYVWMQEDVEPYGFEMIEKDQTRIEYEFNLETFVEFMMIQSNVNVQIDLEKRNINEVKEWFIQSLRPIFSIKNRTLVFKGYSWYIQKTGYGGSSAEKDQRKCSEA